MSVRELALRIILVAALAGLQAAAAAAAPVDSNADAARCAAITSPEQRLACYDALVCAGIAAADARLACYDALARGKPSSPQGVDAATQGVTAATQGVDAATRGVTAATVAEATASAAPAPAAGANAEHAFGLSAHQLPAPPPGPTHIKARVTQVSVGRLGTVSVELDNGQSWTFNDPDALLKSGDAVTIKKAALGSFLMTTPSRHTYRVQRTK